MFQISDEIGKKTNKTLRDEESLKAQLNRQIGFLLKSSAIYDSGDEEEAIRIAGPLRVLLHDTEQSASLLTQLKVKSNLLFADSGIYRDRYNKVVNDHIQRTNPGSSLGGYVPGEAGLVIPRPNLDGTFGWYAPLTETRFHPSDIRFAAQSKPIGFKKWWERPLVENGTLKKYFSRKNLVLIMANQDGYAHVDPALDKDYEDLCNDFLGAYCKRLEPGEKIDIMKPGPIGIPPLRNNIAFASVRQIAFEVLLTLERNGLINPK